MELENMQNDEDVVPEIKLLNSIIDKELKDEEDAKLKEVIKIKANNLYALLANLSEKNLDDDETKKKIKFHIEVGE